MTKRLSPFREVQEHFVSETGIEPPNSLHYRDYWVKPLRTMIDMAKSLDVVDYIADCKRRIARAIGRMAQSELTVVSPKSILSVYSTLYIVDRMEIGTRKNDEENFIVFVLHGKEFRWLEIDESGFVSYWTQEVRKQMLKSYPYLFPIDKTNERKYKKAVYVL